MMNSTGMSRGELLVWVKEVTNIPAARLDDLSTGVHFCHLLHLYTNGKFSLRKVNQNAKGEVESLQNLKLMLYGMEEAKIIQTFDIANIAKKNFKAILEAIQWWHKHFTKNKMKSKPEIDRSKVIFQIKRPLQPAKPKEDLSAAKKSESPLKQTKVEMDSSEVMAILEKDKKYSAPKQSLFPDQKQPAKEEEKQNQNPYPNIEEDCCLPTFKQEPLPKKVQEDSSNCKHIIPQFSFGHQDNFGFLPSSSEQTSEPFNTIKPTSSKKREEDISNKISENKRLFIPFSHQERPIENKEQRIPPIFRSVDKADLAAMRSKSKEEHPSTKFKPAFKSPAVGALNQSIEKRGMSPKMSERTNLLSLDQSEKKSSRPM